MFCHICANWLNIPVLKALRQNCVPVEWPWDRAKVSPSCSFQTCGAGWKCDMKYCQGWFRPECGSGRSSGPVQSWEEKLRQPLLIDHPLVREEDDDSGSWWPQSWWSCVDNDHQEGWKRPAQIAWARCKWPGRCKLNSGTATPDCPQKINKFAGIYIYIHIFCIFLNILVQGCSVEKIWQIFYMNIYVVAPMMPGGITGRKFWNLNTQNTEHTETFKHRIHNSDSYPSFYEDSNHLADIQNIWTKGLPAVSPLAWVMQIFMNLKCAFLVAHFIVKYNAHMYHQTFVLFALFHGNSSKGGNFSWIHHWFFSKFT